MRFVYTWVSVSGTIEEDFGGRHSRSGSFSKDKFLAPASNPGTSSRLSTPIPVTIKTSL
jgi:hypothetical protein